MMNTSLHTMGLLALITAGLLVSASLQAQVDESALPVQTAPSERVDAPPPPMPAEAEEGLEPEVTIIRKDDRTIEEYRLNGQLYMIKITPSKGYPYYLVDADGDGNLETRRNELDPRILVPSWVIFRW